MRIVALIMASSVASGALAAEPAPWATKDLRAGIIGTDTSHVPASLIASSPTRVGRGIAAPAPHTT